MPLQKVGLNLTRFENITTPTFSFKNTSEEIINDIPVKANEITGGWWGLIAMSALFSYLLWKLNQSVAEGGDYGYSTGRSIGIASAIVSIIGLFALNVGYFTNYYHVVIFIIISFISVGVVWKSQN